MNLSTFKTQRTTILIVMTLFIVPSSELWAQNKPVPEKHAAELNLDDKNIAEEFSKEIPMNKKSEEKISISPNHMDDSFSKAQKHGIVPTTKEINVPGTPGRITMVTGADGTYCVYSPTVARTDGIDEIQNGLQNQVRNCPQ